MSVGSVDGNLDAETADGSVALGKVVGEEVRAVAGGSSSNSLRVKAIYAKRAELRSAGTMQVRVRPPVLATRALCALVCTVCTCMHALHALHAPCTCMACARACVHVQVSVLATERGVLTLGDAAAAGTPTPTPSGAAAGSKLGSLDGEIDVLLAGGSLEIQASLRTWSLEPDAPQAATVCIPAAIVGMPSVAVCGVRDPGGRAAAQAAGGRCLGRCRRSMLS